MQCRYSRTSGSCCWKHPLLSAAPGPAYPMPNHSQGWWRAICRPARQHQQLLIGMDSHCCYAGWTGDVTLRQACCFIQHQRAAHCSHQGGVSHCLHGMPPAAIEAEHMLQAQLSCCWLATGRRRFRHQRSGLYSPSGSQRHSVLSSKPEECCSNHSLGRYSNGLIPVPLDDQGARTA